MFSDYRGSVFLFGGVSSNPEPTVWKLEPEYKWKKFNQNALSTIDSRYGHQCVTVGNRLFILGGVSLKKNYFLPEVDTLNLSEGVWKTMLPKTFGFSLLRKNFAALSIGRTIIMHGGIDAEGNILGDTLFMQAGSDSIQSKKISGSPNLTGHSSCLVLPGFIRNLPKFSLRQLPDLIAKVTSDYMQMIGFYLFGGENAKGHLKNDVYCLEVENKDFSWKLMDVKGVKPIKRKFSTLQYFEKGNVVILFGGLANEETSVLNDMWTLDLKELNWISVKLGVKPQPVKSVYFHASCFYEDKMLIIGGMEEKGNFGIDLFAVDLFSFAETQSKKKRKSRHSVEMKKFPKILF